MSAPAAAEDFSLSQNSTLGWMLTANTCAPPRAKDRRHLLTEVHGIMNPEKTFRAETTSGTSYQGFSAEVLRDAKITPKFNNLTGANQTFPDGAVDPTRFHTTSRQQFRDYKLGRPQIVRYCSNDPSESDHPLLGLMHPGRKALVAVSGSHYQSTAQSSYTKPLAAQYEPRKSAARHAPTPVPRDRWLILSERPMTRTG